MEKLANIILYLFIGIELFINIPINRSVPLSKDYIIIFGVILAVIFSFLMTKYLQLPLVVVVILMIFYFAYLKLMLKGFERRNYR
jgi:hypothetical protein